MTKLLDSALVLCDLDHLLLAGDGNMPQVVRDVLQLFSSRGGRLTVFTQRSPRAVRAVLGGVRLAAPALTCGGTLAYRFSEGSGQPLCSFAGCEESIFKKLPAAVGLGIALQMADGSTRVLRMSTALERHLRREFTPFTLCSPADVKGEDGPGRTLAEDRQPAAPAGKQLEHIPHDLRHIAVTGQKEMVQIAEYERRIEKFRHTVPLLSDAIKWVKYSGSSESKRRCSPVMGWMKPNVFAWRH